MEKVQFTTHLVKDGGYTFVFVPSSLLGTRNRFKVKGAINGHPFTISAMPWREDQHVITINAEMRKRMGLVGGEQIEVELEPDSGSEEIAVPDDLASALHARPGAEEAFNKLSPYHRERLVSSVEQAKRPETRSRHVESVVEQVLKEG